MKKVGIITHYDVHNHGALLQLTALIRVLKSRGISAKALQFDKNYDFIGHKLKVKYDISIKSLTLYLEYLKEKGLKCTWYNYRKRKSLNTYKHNENIVGDYYSESPWLDGVIVGSDEVFALHTGPTPAFFGHCLPSDNVFAYAASFGPTTIEDIKRLHALEFIKSGIQDMKYVTVRDKNSADIVESLIDKIPPIVVDPVILYGYKEEISNLEAPKIQNFLLVYSYDNRMNSEDEIDKIREYAKKRGLKIVSPGFFHSWCDYNINIEPIQLLTYFKHAKEVITDTFHGSVMSIITGASFIVKTRESNHFKLANLLKEYGLENRIISNWGDLEDTMKHSIDYSKVNIEIEKRRNFSMAQLDKMIDEMN